MATTNLLETPSRILRRIQSAEQREMPSLSSLSGFAVDAPSSNGSASDEESDASLDIVECKTPTHSTPANSIRQRLTCSPSAVSGAARFPDLIARSAHSSARISTSSHLTHENRHDSFGISPTALTSQHLSSDDDVSSELDNTASSVPEVYLPPEGEDDDGLNMSEYYKSIDSHDPTPRKFYDYVVPTKTVRLL
jgi:hypothetical protein